MENPGSITAADLRAHFVAVYKLNESQAQRMVASAAKSLRLTLDACDDSLRTGRLFELADGAHNLKGVLLNMGQREWAERARRLESAAKQHQTAGCRELLGRLREAAEELVRAAG